MRKIIVATVAASLLAGCAQTTRERNALVGAVIGTGAGAAIGAASTGTPQGGWAGAAIGGATGGVLGYLLTPPEPPRCYRVTRHGRKRVIACP
jgi:hypothetical protein